MQNNEPSPEVVAIVNEVNKTSGATGNTGNNDGTAGDGVSGATGPKETNKCFACGGPMGEGEQYKSGYGEIVCKSCFSIMHTPFVNRENRPQRNSPCPCGKVKPDGTPVKYKNCCLKKL